MNPRDATGATLAGRRPTAILVLLAVIGVLLSAYIGRQEATQYQALERLRIAEAVDAHFASVQDHLAVRETMATVVAALFNPPPLATARPLRDFGDQVTAIIPDIQTVGWLPEVRAATAEDALTSMRNSGVENPRFVDRNGKEVSAAAIDRPLYPIIDVAPERNRWILGVDAGSFAERLDAINRARDTHKIARTVPLRLVQAPDSNALLIYAPVFKDGVFKGVLGFGYKVDQLLLNALTLTKNAPGFDIRVLSPEPDVPLFELSADGVSRSPGTMPASADGTQIERTTEFAGQPLKFVYGVSRNLGRESIWRGLSFAAVSLAITASTITLLGFLTSRASALAREVRSRRSAEDRLKVVIHELNHRVRNVLSVAQAVVRLSFTSGYSLSEVQKTCEGRLQALANAMSLLTASDWKSVSFRNLISEEILPFADRIAVEGPDLALRPRSAQTLALLLYELATNAAKHGALSVSGGKVFLEWEIKGQESPAQFWLRWRESGGPTVATPTRRGFGELLVRRIAPRDVAGHATTNYHPGGFEYELKAPLSEVVYDPNQPEKPRFSGA